MTFEIEVEEREIVMTSYTFTIEADNEEEAREIAYDTYYEYDGETQDIDSYVNDMYVAPIEPMPCDDRYDRDREFIGGTLCAG